MLGLLYLRMWQKQPRTRAKHVQRVRKLRVDDDETRFCIRRADTHDPSQPVKLIKPSCLAVEKCTRNDVRDSVGRCVRRHKL